MSSSQLQDAHARATWASASPLMAPYSHSQRESNPRQPRDSDTSAPLPLNAWNITKVWGRKPGNRVIDDLDLTLEPGTLTWIGGSNGVGKTTLLRVLAGLIGPNRRTRPHVRPTPRAPAAESLRCLLVVHP
jgi:ABC-type transport system involved in cytochrome bd biosynthesis fused ATPase/permease subunit